MKTIRIMAIIGAVLAGLYWLVAFGYNDYDYYEIVAGWGVITTLYFTAFSIVGIVTTRKGKE